ncbi:hypothetical protein SEA_CLOWN_75 [Gordonia phage Clown]|uniref:Uncharacterized protein n=1 Tax=Gordonia phage Clown TaxID=2759393 RepID=A0A7L7SI14_9CAUD|nr:hypothetical protein KNV25_gp75 [Gordonia phage Clown]QOC56073.1 hypothetical protein SEA_CLOWN_75 [Gordonia phage Clown]
MTVTDDDIRAAAAALARAEIFDDRVTSDDARNLAWAEAMAPHGIDVADALAAVTAHYSKPGADTIRVGDVIAAARKIRAERAEREKGEQVSQASAITPPDNQLGGLPIAGADGKPIWSAYDEHGAIGLPCTTCDAQPDDACINLATGLTRKIPCMTRLRDGYRASKQDADQQSPTTPRKTRPESTETEPEW